MHILLGILAAAGVIAYFIIRANQVNRAARELAETAGDVKRYVRRSRWQSRTRGDGINDLRDPRLAATVMMYAIAKSDGEVTDRQRQTMRDQLHAYLALEGEAADAVIAEARWLTQDLNDTATVLRRAATPISENCTDAEKAELIGMLETVAAAEGPASDHHTQAIDGLKRKLGMVG